MREFLPEGWSVKKSSDYCLRVADGTHDTPKPAEVGRPLITSKNLDNGHIVYDGAYLISETDYLQINKRSKVDRWDVLFSMIGTVDEIALVRTEPDFAIKNIGLFKSKTKEDGIWLYYYLTSSIGQAALDTFLSGTSQQFVALGDLRKVQVIVPTNKSKAKIAATLSAYDELIANNQRRIALLEKMAEEIYREWFIRRRFPGHEKVKVIKGVPEGWSFDKASMYIGLAKGKSYAGEELTEDTAHMPFINLKSFNRGGGYREDGLKYYSGRYKPEQVVHQNDVVMAVTDMTQDRAVIGRVARMPDLGEKGAVISLDTVKLVPKNIHKTFLYAYMRHSGFANFIKEFANGANVLHLKPDLITQQKIIVPPKQLQSEFAPLVEPLYAEADLLGMANRRLEKMRDALLPRLISGKLSVENLDIQFPPGMEESLHEH